MVWLRFDAVGVANGMLMFMLNLMFSKSQLGLECVISSLLLFRLSDRDLGLPDGVQTRSAWRVVFVANSSCAHTFK